jgi:hypothetical protein
MQNEKEDDEEYDEAERRRRWKLRWKWWNVRHRWCCRCCIIRDGVDIEEWVFQDKNVDVIKREMKIKEDDDDIKEEMKKESM